MIPRYTPLRRRTPLARSTKRIRPRARGFARRRTLSPRYLDWIREQPCLAGDMHVCCGVIEAHHVSPGPGCARQARCNDFRAVPLCTLAHHEYHQHRDVFANYSIDFERAIARLNHLYEIGTGRKAV